MCMLHTSMYFLEEAFVCTCVAVNLCCVCVWMCVCVCLYIYIYIYIYIDPIAGDFILLYVCIPTCMYAYVYVCMPTCACTCMYMAKCMYLTWLHVCICFLPMGYSYRIGPHLVRCISVYPYICMYTLPEASFKSYTQPHLTPTAPEPNMPLCMYVFMYALPEEISTSQPVSSNSDGTWVKSRLCTPTKNE
jgi:hypothetical protein